MKFNQQLFFTCMLILGASSSSAQSRTPEAGSFEGKNIAKINLLSPFFGTLSVQHEHILTSETSVQLGLYYFSGEVPNGYIPLRGVCFTPEYRMYITNEAPNGFYVQPYARFARFWQPDMSTNLNPGGSASRSVNFNGVAGGVVFGRQWLMFDKITFDMYIGPLYTIVFFDDTRINRKDLPPPMDGYWFRGGITFGFLLN